MKIGELLIGKVIELLGGDDHSHAVDSADAARVHGPSSPNMLDSSRSTSTVDRANAARIDTTDRRPGRVPQDAKIAPFVKPLSRPKGVVLLVTPNIAPSPADNTAYRLTDYANKLSKQGYRVAVLSTASLQEPPDAAFVELLGRSCDWGRERPMITSQKANESLAGATARLLGNDARYVDSVVVMYDGLDRQLLRTERGVDQGVPQQLAPVLGRSVTYVADLTRTEIAMMGPGVARSTDPDGLMTPGDARINPQQLKHYDSVIACTPAVKKIVDRQIIDVVGSDPFKQSPLVFTDSAGQRSVHSIVLRPAPGVHVRQPDRTAYDTPFFVHTTQMFEGLGLEPAVPQTTLDAVAIDSTPGAAVSNTSTPSSVAAL